MARKAKRNYLVYLIKNTVNGLQYIGITSTSLASRWRQHKYDASKGKGYRLHNAIRKYGIDKFTHTTIACARSESDLLKLEKILIEQHETYGRHGRQGYNLTRGGEGLQGAGIKQVVKDMEFDSFTDAAEYFGVDRSVAFNRMRALGWTIEQALELEPPSYRVPSQAIEFCLDGKVYESFWKACEDQHINYQTAVHRQLRGWTDRQVFSLDPPPLIKPTTGNEIEVDDERFPSIAEAIRHFKIPHTRVYRRLRKGWSIEQAFDIDPPPPRRHKKGKSVVVSGMLFNSIQGAAKYFGINKETAMNRYKDNRRLTMEQVFGLQPIPRKKRAHEFYFRIGDSITVEGKEYKSNAAAARAYGLTPKKFHARIVMLGWTIEQALGIDPPPNNRSNKETKNSVIVEGKKYRNFATACNAYGVKYDRAVQRVKKLGWSVEKALEVDDH